MTKLYVSIFRRSEYNTWGSKFASPPGDVKLTSARQPPYRFQFCSARRLLGCSRPPRHGLHWVTTIPNPAAVAAVLPHPVRWPSRLRRQRVGNPRWRGEAVGDALPGGEPISADQEIKGGRGSVGRFTAVDGRGICIRSRNPYSTRRRPWRNTWSHPRSPHPTCSTKCPTMVTEMSNSGCTVAAQPSAGFTSSFAAFIGVGVLHHQYSSSVGVASFLEM